MLFVNGELKMSNIMFENVNRPVVQNQPLRIKPTGNATFLKLHIQEPCCMEWPIAFGAGIQRQLSGL